MMKTNQRKISVVEKKKAAHPAEVEDVQGLSDLEDEELCALAFDDSTPKQRQIKRRKQQAGSKMNVLYLGHIPHGFHENELKKFLTQFGKVVNIRVSRSAKTGNSRGYGFLQFANGEVTDIVQKTLHGYILLGRALVCQRVPEEHVHDRMFMGGLRAGQTEFSNPLLGARKKRVLRHAQRSESKEAEGRRVRRLSRAGEARQKNLAAKGIPFVFSGGYSSQKV